jgi:hypothetical protein
MLKTWSAVASEFVAPRSLLFGFQVRVHTTWRRLMQCLSPWWYVYLTSHWTTSRWTSHPRPWWTYSTSYIGQWIILVFVLTAFVPCWGNNNTSIDDYGAMYSLGLETGAPIQMLVLPCCGSCFALTMGVSSFRTELAWRRPLKAMFWRRNGTPTRCKDIVLLKLAAPADYNHILKVPSDATIQLLY